MSSVGLLLLSKVLREQAYDKLLAGGFREEDLATPQEQALHQFIKDYYESPITQGSTPALDYTAMVFPDLQFPDPGNTSLKELLAVSRMQRIDREANSIIAKASKGLKGLSHGATTTFLQELREELDALLSEGAETTDTHMTQGLVGALHGYDAVSTGKGDFWRWPWPELHAYTPGMESTDFAIIYGRPKNKKTFVLLYFILACFFMGERLLIYSKEMPEEQIWRRLLAFIANAHYTHVLLGTLPPEGYDQMANRVAEVIDRIEQGHGDIICISGLDAPKGKDNVDWLRQKIRQHKPHRCFVDGMHLLSSGAKDRHRQIEEVATALRMTALKLRTPIIATLHANRSLKNKEAMTGEGNLEDVAGSDSVSQLGTSLWRVVANKGSNTVSVLWTGGRETGIDGFEINAVPCTDFSFRGVIGTQDATAMHHADLAAEKAGEAPGDIGELSEDPAEGPPSLPPPPAPTKSRRKGRASPVERALSRELGGER